VLVTLSARAPHLAARAPIDAYASGRPGLDAAVAGAVRGALEEPCMFAMTSPDLDTRIEGWCARAELEPEATLSLLDAEAAHARVEGSSVFFTELVRCNVLLRIGRCAEALACLDDAVGAAHTERDALLELHALLVSAKAHTVSGDHRAALTCFEDGLSRARAVSDRYGEGMFLANLGFFHGRLQEAVAYYDEALPHALALEWKRGQALILGGLAGVLLRVGRVDEGARKYLESIEVLRELGDAFLVTRHYLLLGEALLGAGRAAEALPMLAEAVRCAEVGAFNVELAQALQVTSQASEALGDLEGALRTLRRHVEVEKAANHLRNKQELERIKLEHRLAAAKHEADTRSARNTELEALNTALRASLDRQQTLQVELERLASYDALTGLYNRRRFSDMAERELARAARTGRGVALLAVDVDHFKRVNDHHGHAEGDAVLVELSARLRALVRAVDLVGRWGGEELCVLVVEVDVAGAQRAAERIRLAVAASPMETAAGPVSVTLSIGVAMYAGVDDTLARLLNDADHALYAAKNGGRDRWVMATRAS